ncbi:MAG TPA: hypothetical protein V6C97_25655 [Oculatellaceae cyanobacterium]
MTESDSSATDQNAAPAPPSAGLPSPPPAGAAPAVSTPGGSVPPATPIAKKAPARGAEKKPGDAKPAENKVVKLLEKNQLGMTLPEMAGGPRQLKKIRTLRPILAEAIRLGLVMPISQRAGHTVYRLVKYLGPR